MLAALLFLTGCETSGLFDPGEMMRTSKATLLVGVLPSLNGAQDETEAEWPEAQDVKQADLIPSATDYVIGHNDLLQISITEVAGPGVETVKTSRVSESGNISLPLIRVVKAAGLTEAELEKAIADKYRSENIIQNAQVSVTVIEARGRTFSILGAISRPGQYQILESDFRLLAAITMAGDIPIQGIEYAYVIRKEPKKEGTTKPDMTPNGGKPDTTKPPLRDPLEGKPGSRAIDMSKARLAQTAANQPVHLDVAADPAKPGDDEGDRKILVDGKWVPVKGSSNKETTTTVAPPVKPADPLAPKTPADPLAPKQTETPANTTTTGGAEAGTDMSAKKPGSFEFDAPVPDPDTRVIRVPIERLLTKGDRQFNIVIRPNDTIIIPSPKVGEYYMGGHVGRPGVYSLTGRQITLKQAIISAGMIDPLGWPERTEVIRRIGKDREMFVRVNLPKIFAGEEPDFFLRPYDTVDVGSNMIAPFLAAMRGAFRFTYGFGFIYDRNYNTSNNNVNGR
jgi:protein involved in polysaccharide export with SLBB domain